MSSLIQLTMIFTVLNIFPCIFSIPNIVTKRLFEWHLKQRLPGKDRKDGRLRDRWNITQLNSCFIKYKLLILHNFSLNERDNDIGYQTIWRRKKTPYKFHKSSWTINQCTSTIFSRLHINQSILLLSYFSEVVKPQLTQNYSNEYK